MRKPVMQYSNAQAKTDLELFRIFTSLFRELNDIWLLIALIDLDTED
jgi:hypothetical protein